jgi:hypothetical protein
MKIIYQRVAGLDVHKKTVAAARMRVAEEDLVKWPQLHSEMGLT